MASRCPVPHRSTVEAASRSDARSRDFEAVAVREVLFARIPPPACRGPRLRTFLGVSTALSMTLTASRGLYGLEHAREGPVAECPGK